MRKRKSLYNQGHVIRARLRVRLYTHYVDNNSTPTMVFNLLEAKHSLFESTSARHTLPPAWLLCATIVHTPSCYARQSWLSATIPLLTLAASAVLSGVRRQKEC